MKFLRFLRKWNELLSIPIAILLWAFSPLFIRSFDPTAAVYDSGVLQILLFAIIGMLIFNGLAWLMLKLNFPQVYTRLDDILDSNLTAWQKSVVSIWLFSLYFLALVFLARIL